MKKGTVKFFNSEKGFGFIVPEDGSEELFVHHTGLIDDINEGDQVEYEVGEGRKGPNAIDVKVVG
jgi:CspA family cold shock protein